MFQSGWNAKTQSEARFFYLSGSAGDSRLRFTPRITVLTQCGFERPDILNQCGFKTADVIGQDHLCSQVATATLSMTPMLRISGQHAKRTSIPTGNIAST